MDHLSIIGLFNLWSIFTLRESPTVGYLSFLCVLFFHFLYILAVNVSFCLSERGHFYT